MLVIFALVICTSIEAGAQSIHITLNGDAAANHHAVLKSSRLMLPVSFVRSELGASVRLSKDGKQLDIYMPQAEHRLPKPVYYQDEVLVLMYHHILDIEETTPSAISLKDFKKQMELLHAGGFHVISMDEYADYMLNGAEMPDNAVLITFDDGYESFYTLAYPVLKKYGFPAANFVIVSYVDKQYGIPKLTWDQMREMQEHGMSFYNHTYDLHKYGPIDRSGKNTKPMLAHRMYDSKLGRTETRQEYLKRIEEDLALAELRLREELGNERGIIAFPYGAYNEQVLEICRKLGIELSFTIEPGMNSREDRNAYRLNGAEVKMAPEELIVRMMNRGIQDRKDANSLRVAINGRLVLFESARPELVDRETGEALLPLKELSSMIGLHMRWDAAAKTVHLTTLD